MKLNLGSGGDYKSGYVNVDLYEPADVKHDLLTPLPYPDNSVEEIYASHVVEHFGFKEIPIVLADWYRILKVNGRLELECPDILVCARYFVENKNDHRWGYWLRTFYGSQDNPGDFHKNGFTYERLVEQLLPLGFRDFQRLPDSDYNLTLECFK